MVRAVNAEGAAALQWEPVSALPAAREGAAPVVVSARAARVPTSFGVFWAERVETADQQAGGGQVVTRLFDHTGDLLSEWGGFCPDRVLLPAAEAAAAVYADPRGCRVYNPDLWWDPAGPLSEAAAESARQAAKTAGLSPRPEPDDRTVRPLALALLGAGSGPLAGTGVT